NESRRGELRFRPDLWVTTMVRCPAVAGDHVAHRRLGGSARNRVQLEQAIERSASTTASDGFQMCTYVPDVTVYTNGRIRGEGLAETCRGARGGGPAWRGPPARRHSHRTALRCLLTRKPPPRVAASRLGRVRARGAIRVA